MRAAAVVKSDVKNIPAIKLPKDFIPAVESIKLERRSVLTMTKATMILKAIIEKS
jgi:hypothetical protein